jgi:hypothetical protein
MFNRFINGPTLNQSGISDPNVIGGKNGVWVLGSPSVNAYTISMKWVAPAGQEVVLTVLGSISLFAMMLDARGLLYSLVRDFPYLTAGSAPANDSHFTSVRMLVGADGSVVDESGVHRTLTNSGATLGVPVIASAGGAVFASASNYIATVNAPDVQVGPNDMTVETWYAGTGTTPGGEQVIFSKSDGATNLEWLLDYFSSNFQSYVSADGSNWNHTIAFSLTGPELDTFYNNAPRHLALVKFGSTWTLYINGEAGINTVTVPTAFAGTAPLALGYTAAAVSGIGTYDDFRATFGLARYTANMVTLDPRKFPRSTLPSFLWVATDDLDI